MANVHELLTSKGIAAKRKRIMRCQERRVPISSAAKLRTTVAHRCRCHVRIQLYQAILDHRIDNGGIIGPRR